MLERGRNVHTGLIAPRPLASRHRGWLSFNVELASAARWLARSLRAIVLVMRFSVTLERDETGMVIATCPAIPGCVSQGKTDDEAIANIREAIVGCLEVRAAQGLPLTVRTVDLELAVA